MNFKEWLLKNYKADDKQYGEIVKRIQSDRKFPDMSRIRLVRYLVEEYDYEPSGEMIKKYHNLYNEYESTTNTVTVKESENSTIRLAKGEASKQLKCASIMPPLKHKVGGPDEKFDITKSEVSSWLTQQPEIMQYVFSRIKNSGLIVYDPEEGTWKGKDYKENCNYKAGEF